MVYIRKSQGWKALWLCKNSPFPHTLTGSGSRPPCLCARKSWKIHPGACRCVSDKPCTPAKMSQNIGEIQKQEANGSETAKNKQVLEIILENSPSPSKTAHRFVTLSSKLGET